jgi:hypothetical protein
MFSTQRPYGRSITSINLPLTDELSPTRPRFTPVTTARADPSQKRQSQQNHDRSVDGATASPIKKRSNNLPSPRRISLESGDLVSARPSLIAPALVTQTQSQIDSLPASGENEAYASSPRVVSSAAASGSADPSPSLSPKRKRRCERKPKSLNPAQQVQE